MGSRLPKVLHPLAGRPLARWPVEAAREAGCGRVLAVVPAGLPEVMAGLGDDLEYVEQPAPLGTGDACARALAALGAAEHVLVLPGDNPLLDGETLRSLVARHLEAGAAATLLTAAPPDPAAYGRVVRDGAGRVLRVVEAGEAGAAELALREINTAVYVFSVPALQEVLPRLHERPGGERYLTDAIGFLAEGGSRVEALPAPDPDVAHGVNDRLDLARAAALVRARILRRHMRAGVTVEDPAATYVDVDVSIGPDTTLLPGTHLQGRTAVGAGCELGPDVRITDCTLGECVRVHYSVLAGSTVGDGTRIGPYAQLRPGCRVGRKVKVGNFVELKNAEIGDRASVGHHAYIGDARVGEETNIGAGTITCNYDGRRKHRTEIGARAFIGSHSTLIAPVTVGDGAFVAAGTVVSDAVPADALAIGRAHQANREGWARRRRDRECEEP